MASQVGVLLQVREMVFGKEGWGGEEAQTMLDVRTQESLSMGHKGLLSASEFTPLSSRSPLFCSFRCSGTS